MFMPTSIRVLIVEDRPADAELIIRELRQAGFEPDWQRVETEPEFLAGLNDRPDIILADHNLPQFSASRALGLLQERGPDIPFIIVTGSISEEVAVERMKQGATDYLLKDRLTRLGQAVEHALKEKLLREEKRAAQEVLAQLAALVDYSDDAIIGTGLDGTIFSWNAAAERIYGYSAEEAKGRPISFIAPPDRLNEVNKILEQFKGGEHVPHFETVRLRKDGQKIHVSLVVSPIKDAEGKIIGASAIARDLTERKRAEEKIRLQSAALESAANAVVITDRDGIITWVNPAFTKLTGYSPEEAIDQNIRLLKSGAQDRSFYENLWNTILSGQVWSGEIVNRRKDGVLYTEEQTVTPVRNNQGEVTHFIAVKQNITDRKRAEKERERLISVIEAATDLVGIADPQGRALYINKNGRKMVGIGEDEDISGFQVTETHPEPARKFVLEEAIPTAIREGVWRGETSLLTRDGREIPVSQVILAHRAPDGSVEFLSTIMRDITERKRAEEEIQRNLERIRALHEIDVAITSTLDLRAVLDVLLEKIDLFLPYSAATIRLWNEKTRLLEPVACRNINEEEWKADEWKGGRGSPNAVFETKATVSIGNCQTDPRVRDHEFFRKHSLVSYLGVPLFAHDQILGVISFYTKTEHEFTSEESGFLETLAAQAAIAIYNSQLYGAMKTSRSELESTNRRLEKSLQELSGFYSALAPLAPANSLNQLMEGIIARLMIATGADAALIRLWDDAKSALTLAGQRGFPDYYLKAVEAASASGAADWVFKSGEPIVTPNTAAEPRFKGKIQLKVGFRSCAMLPLKVENRVRGIVHLVSRDLGFFDEAQRDHLMTIARQMSIMLENRELFEHLRASRDELERSNRVKDEFLSVMSHELRTPLNVVVGYTGMIMDGLLGEVNEKQKEAMAKIVRRTNDQLGLVNNILYATVLETEKIKVESHPVVLGDFFKQLSSTYETPLNKQLSFNWDCPSPLAVIHTDSTKLKQILQNLIDNAIKFTSKGNVTISARIKQATGERQQEEPVTSASSLTPHAFVEFKVADTGVGIPPNALPLIFDKFRQADSSETRLYGGVGMGLYIVKKFAELLGGTVEVESEAGKGSTFIVKIPLEF